MGSSSGVPWFIFLQTINRYITKAFISIIRKKLAMEAGKEKMDSCDLQVSHLRLTPQWKNKGVYSLKENSCNRKYEG